MKTNRSYILGDCLSSLSRDKRSLSDLVDACLFAQRDLLDTKLFLVILIPLQEILHQVESLIIILIIIIVLMLTVNIALSASTTHASEFLLSKTDDTFTALSSALVQLGGENLNNMLLLLLNLFRCAREF